MNLLKLSKFVLTICLLSIISCNDNPYPEVDELGKDRRPPPGLKAKALSMSLNDKIELQEGVQTQFLIKVDVEAPGVPIIDIEGLPEGATFDEETFTVSWTPTYSDGNSPVDPSIKSMIYPIVVTLKSSLDDKRAIRKESNLVVFDVPRSVRIDTRDTFSVNENSDLRARFSVENRDYPDGPFLVESDGLPPGAEIIADDKNVNFQIKYRPTYQVVNLNDGSDDKEFLVTLKAVNPAGHFVKKEIKITVDDVRQDVVITAADEIEQGLDVHFQVTASDLNSEIAPKITFTVSKPSHGEWMNPSLKENPESYTSVLTFKWNNIPQTYIGRTFNFPYKACVRSSTFSYSKCSRGSTKIKIVSRPKLPPVIDRDDWPVKELVYLDNGDYFSRSIDIEDGETGGKVDKVEIFPEEVREKGNISWSRGRLSMRFTEAGVYQFQVKATSVRGLSTTESFIVDVFPANRKTTLFLADEGTRYIENVFYRENISSMDFMNPAIQRLTRRNMSGRKTLVIGTSVLKSMNQRVLNDTKLVGEVVEEAIELVDHVVVASPLLDQLPEKFLNTLKEDLGVSILGRYSELTGTPDLSTMNFVVTSQFESSTHNVSLNLSTTGESYDPLIFNGGLDDPNKNCKAVMGLSSLGQTPYAIGLTCRKLWNKTKGRVSILGTEWADLKFHEDDNDIPSKWFNTMLTGRFW